MEYCGIDAHSKSSTVCVINQSGEELMLTKTPNTKQELGEKVGMWDIRMPIVIEACSTSRPVTSYWRSSSRFRDSPDVRYLFGFHCARTP